MEFSGQMENPMRNWIFSSAGLDDFGNGKKDVLVHVTEENQKCRDMNGHEERFSLIFHHFDLVGVERMCNLSHSYWYYVLLDNNRILCFRSLDDKGKRERLELRTFGDQLRGDIRINTYAYDFTDWELTGQFKFQKAM